MNIRMRRTGCGAKTDHPLLKVELNRVAVVIELQVPSPFHNYPCHFLIFIENHIKTSFLSTIDMGMQKFVHIINLRHGQLSIEHC